MSKRSITSNHAIVGSDIGSILFKKENNSVYFKNTQKSILQGKTRRYDHLLKWLYDKKDLLGIDITVDIKNYVEQLDSIYEEREDIKKDLILPISGTAGATLNVNGTVTCNSTRVQKIKEFYIPKFLIKGIKTITGKIDITIEYSHDNKEWHKYDTFQVGAVPYTSNNQDYNYTNDYINQNLAFSSEKRISLDSHNLYLRLVLDGKGSITTENVNAFSVNINGLYVLKEEYTTNIDEEQDIYVDGSTDTYLTTTRSLLHRDGFFGANNFYKRNQKQNIKINLMISGGIKYKIIEETFVDNFVSNIAVRDTEENGFFLFEENNVTKPRISIPSQVKQLLYKYGDNFVNRRIIEPNTDFSKYGYQIEDGIHKYDKNGEDLGKVVSTDLSKIQFVVSNKTNFSNLLIGNPILSSIRDFNGKLIFGGEILLSDTFQENIDNIMNLIRNKKTFYKASIILYSEYNQKVDDIITSLSAGDTTPQDVFLVCPNPNDSNVDHCSFNKTELGRTSFKTELVKAVKNKIGLQFTSLEDVFNNISDYINGCIEKEKSLSLSNVVGINIYNMISSHIDNNYYNKYGYYVNTVVSNFEKSENFVLEGTSKSNSLEDIVQYDIGTSFSATLDLTDNFPDLIDTMCVEDDDKGTSISITHNENIMWKYVIGSEQVTVSNSSLKDRYSFSINKFLDDNGENKTTLKLRTNFNFTSTNRGSNNFTVNIKNKNGIVCSYIMDFIVDYPEPHIDLFEVKTEDVVNETGYTGNRTAPYTKDNFIECGINLEDNYEFLKDEYSILIENESIPDYKYERKLVGNWQSKIHTIHIDDIKNTKELTQKIKFGKWKCSIVRNKYNLKIKNFTLDIPLNIEPVLDLTALPVEEDFEDMENNGLQQGKDVYIKFKFKGSDYFKKIKDWITYCKEVRFIVNGANFTSKPECFTYLESNQLSLNSVTNHITDKVLDERTEMRWLISGTNEGNSNSYLLPIANLAGDEKKTKTIRLDFVMFDGTVVDTSNVKIGETGKIKAPIVCGSDEHFEKLKYVFAKSNKTNVDQLTPEQIKKVKEQLESLGVKNYSNQQIINNSEHFVFYSDLLEIKFDFGVCEYFTVSQANNTTEMTPVTRDGIVRFVIDDRGIDEYSKGVITIKGYIKLSDGLVISSEERVISFYRKKLPSLIQTGDDYTKYVQYEIGEKNYYSLKTVIQSKIALEDLNGTYSSEWMSHIEVDLVDVDKRTVIAHGPDVRFYDGFIPQRFVFDNGLTEDDLSSIADDERFPIEKTKKYKELEKILNNEIFSKDRHLGQIFYLRFKGVETAKNKRGEEKIVKGRETFYPIIFTEKLKELVITPANGIIVKNDGYSENYYTYKNKVSFILESNNAEYFMYRTDRSASFQKVYPKSIGYTRMLKIVVSTYDVGNHFLEVKQKAEGETESNVYSIIVEKINAVKQPHITGNEIVDENPRWTLHPIEDAVKYHASVITDEKIHSEKDIDALQYEVEISPDMYLENGYHILEVISADKIGNTSTPSYFITRKIGRPVASPITGLEKTSENYIKWEWRSQYHEGVKEYITEVNGVEKNTIPASLDGFNEYILRYFQGKPISDGMYELRLWAVNELGNRSYIYSSYLTEKGSKITNLACEFYKYKGDYTNKLQAKILTDDPAIKEYEYEIFKNENGNIVSVTGVMKTSSKELPFLLDNGNRVELENGEYYFAFRGVNYIGEKTDYVRIPFIFRLSAPEKPYIYYLKTVKTTNPVIFVKETGNEPIASIEIKVGEHNFEKIRNNVWRPNYALNLGVNNIVIRVTDYAGNQSEYGDFVEVTQKGINQFQEDYMADMNNPIVTLDFNLPEMSNFGHVNFRIQQENLGIDVLANVNNANNIEIPLTNETSKFPDGIYTFVIKLYDELTNSYDYIADYFMITIDSKKPLKPYFLNSGYDGIEYNRQYIKNKNPKWLWKTDDVQNLKEYIIDLYVLDNDKNDFVNYGNSQFNNYSTGLVGQFQTPDELDDGTYKITVKSVGLNNLESDVVTFFTVIKNSLPKPPKFDLKKLINRKYENKNTNVSWIWEDTNIGNDVLVNYKVKINEEEFSDEIGNITHYEETRPLKDGPNTIMVIGRDKAGNWSTANIINANVLGPEYLKHTKIIDTAVPEKMSDEDVIINILDSNSFETLFRNDNKAEEYFLFELYTLTQSNEEVIFVNGNTLPKGTTDVYFEEVQAIPGVSIGALNGKQGYCEVRATTDKDKTQNSLYFTNLLNNDYFLRIYGVDYAGNISEPLIKKIIIQDLTKLKPKFILPKETHTNNSTIIFQWILDEPNIERWEYQLVTPYSNSEADLLNPSKWKTLEVNSYTINNIPKIIAGNDADGDYTFYVRAIFKEMVIQEGTGSEVNKRSDIGTITVHLDRKLPKGIIFTNKAYTTDNSVLRWTWNYTGEGDEVNGVYVSFNPNLPLDDWEKIYDKNIYESFKERQDGVYTVYMKTFDTAGNINETIYSNSITLDRVPPFSPIINGGSSISTNVIPTIQWENDVNYYKYAWLIMTLEDFNQFKKVYDKLIKEDFYKLTNDDWSYLFFKEDCNLDNVHEELKQFSFNQNDLINTNEITVNSSGNKNGISEEGEYVFLLSGFDENHNWSEEFEYQFINYDITLPDITKMKFISPTYVVTEERRPKWVWRVPNDVVRCEYSLEKNGYNDGSNTGTINKKASRNSSTIDYSFQPEYNLTQGEYRLIVDCYDQAGNTVQISKSVIVEGNSTSFESQFFDIVLPGISNRVRIKMNMYSDVYTITEIDINTNSVLTYKESKDLTGGYKIFEFGKTELNIKEKYDFNITSYDLVVK